MSGPNRLADRTRDQLDDLCARLEVEPSRAERSKLNKQIFRLKFFLRWCESRAGYVVPQ